MKKTFYFSHDFNARNDVKLQEVMMRMGHEGIGLFWCLVEMMYEQGGKLEIDQCDSIAFAIRTESEKIKTLIDIVFEKDDTYFWSKSVLKRIKMQQEKSKKAKESAQKRWKNEAKSSNASSDADAMRTHSDGNAIKEKKIKESKVNIKKENIKEKISSSQKYLENVSLEDFEDIEITEKQLRLEAERALNWLKAKGERKKDYKAYLRNWVLKVYKKKQGTMPSHAQNYEIDPDGIARLREMKSNFKIRGME